jgi:hypothetical protein
MIGAKVVSLNETKRKSALSLCRFNRSSSIREKFGSAIALSAEGGAVRLSTFAANY